jgi:ABC-type lipoprotein release transport system permease subunit
MRRFAREPRRETFSAPDIPDWQAAAVKQVLSGLVFGVTPGDPASFALAAILLAAVIVAASAVPAWRASRVDPLEALRAE